MLFEETGNLFDLEADAFAHGVNTCGRMHAGIAVEFRIRYPEMYREYRKKCFKGELKGGDVFFWPGENGSPPVFNLVTQDTLEYANKNYLNESFERMLLMSRNSDLCQGIERIAIPYIGCGHGGLTKQDLLEAALPFIGSRRNDLIVSTDWNEFGK